MLFNNEQVYFDSNYMLYLTSCIINLYLTVTNIPIFPVYIFEWQILDSKFVLKYI